MSLCLRCGAAMLHTGEAKLIVTFTIDELAKLAEDTLDYNVRERILKAIGLIDQVLEKKLRE